MQSEIEKIIKDGCLAPSGENCQPWRFSVKENAIRVYNRPDADRSLYNSKQKGTYVAHGALIENMALSAAENGYEAGVELFPSPNEPDLVCVMTLNKASPKAEALYPFLARRCTNRKDFTGAKLTDDQKIELIAAAGAAGFGELRLVDDDASLGKLAGALATNEKILFENKLLHDFFYGHILWKEADEDKAGGFYIKTLEFLPHQLKGVELFKNWTVLKIMNKLVGASKMIVKEIAEKYARSGTLGAIIMKGSANEDFVNAGRAMESAWLAAARLGLSLHPCTGVLYFNEQIKDGGGANFSDEHRALIASSYKDIAEVFGAGGRTIAMLWRIGFADPPTARSMRMAPEILN